uniref:Uncharacterized protein n=1 Tax=Anolis carolinensis TaxID=28377 RepID=A0A803TU81_ANOCA
TSCCLTPILNYELFVSRTACTRWLVTHLSRCIAKYFCPAAAVLSWIAGKAEQLKKNRSLHMDSL